MADFLIWGWWYVASFLVVLGISYLLSVLLLRFTRRFFFKSSDLIIFSTSTLFIITTLLSWAFAIDLFIKIPYRPIEFIGQPFWIPNILLGVILIVFASKQIKKWHSDIKTSTVPRLFTAVLSWALLVVAIGLLVYTRADYYSNQWEHRIVTYLAAHLGKPQMCESINPYNGWRSECVLKSLNVANPESTDECNYFAVQGGTDRVDCVVAKAIRNDKPDLCNEFLNEDVYGPMSSYETFRCMSNFVGTKEWSKVCEDIPVNYPDKPHFLEYANCSNKVIHEEVKPDKAKIESVAVGENDFRYDNGIFNISFPEVFVTWDDKTFSPFGVGFKLSRSGENIWSAAAYDKNITSVEKQVDQVGQQFDDRVVKVSEIEVNGLDSTLVIVTTPSRPTWRAEKVIIDGVQAGYEGLIFVISNGASDIANFEDFYNSFELVKKSTS